MLIISGIFVNKFFNFLNKFLFTIYYLIYQQTYSQFIINKNILFVKYFNLINKF